MLVFIAVLYFLFVLVQYKIETSHIKFSNFKQEEFILQGKILWVIKNEDLTDLVVLSNIGKVYLTIKDKIFQENQFKINLNDFVILKTQLSTISLNNSYNIYLYNSFGVSNIGDVEEILSVEPNDNLFYKFLNYIIFLSNCLKEKIIKITKERLNKPHDSIILRLTLGYKDQEINEIISYFQNAGVIHILVVSGLHVGFIYILIFFILKFVPFINRKAKILVSLLSVIFYMFITGCSPPVVRATIIILCFGVAELLNRKQSSLHSLILSFLILLIINSNNLFNPSFQLSFMSFFGIVYFYNSFYTQIKEYIENLPSVIRYIIQLFLITFSVQIMLIPLIIYYFNKISFISFLSNIIVVPITSLLLWLSIILYFLELVFNDVPYLFWMILEKLSFIYIEVVKLFSKLPLNIINITKLTLSNTLIYYLLILSIPLWLKNKKYKSLVLVILFSIISLSFNFNFDKKFRLTFLNVYLGDCILVSSEDSQNFLIDCGESKYVAMYNILPYLKKNRINEIQHLIITHPHYPHYGGLEFLLDNFKIKNVYLNNLISEDQNYKYLIEKIKNKNLNLIFVNSEIKIKFKNGELKLIPNIVNHMYDKIEFFDTNSLFIEIKYKDYTFILPNDIPFYYFKDKILQYRNSKLILQTPRHGKYEEDFVLLKEFLQKEKDIKIKFSLVSTDEIKQNLKILKFPVYSTSDYGDIKVEFNKDKQKELYSLDYGLDNILIKL